MITRLISSFFRGLLLILILDFILFAGMIGNYFHTLNIREEYFNPIFVDNQIYSLLLILALPVGYFFSYTSFKKSFQIIYLILLLVFSLVFIKSIGFSVGEFFFLKKDSIKINERYLSGEILYIGREYLYFRKDLSDKTLKFKKDLIE